jgi:UDP-GlcNAc:undecaprenyl-phosphate/decaprenyl-phosphate GlcNAc-1-phosphate transferase
VEEFRLPHLWLYALSLGIPVAATVLLTPLAARLARRLNVLDHPAEHKYHQEATPYLGGLALGIGLVIAGGVAAGAEGQLVVVLLGGLALSILGLLDDQGITGPSVKFLVQVGAAAALWLAGIRGGIGIYPLDLLLSVLWVVAVTNSVNIFDNMDGLAAGVSATSATTFFVIAAADGHFLVASLALAAAGASLGFLLYNFPPARIFMGDAGSLLLGFLLAALGLKLDLVGDQGMVRAAVPVLILGVPLFDTALVIVARLRGRRPFYRGGTDHSSHRLASLGLSHRLVLWIVMGVHAACCAVALWLTEAPFWTSVVVIAVVTVVALVALVVLLRIEPGRRWEALQSQHPRPETGAHEPDRRFG